VCVASTAELQSISSAGIGFWATLPLRPTQRGIKKHRVDVLITPSHVHAVYCQAAMQPHAVRAPTEQQQHSTTRTK
jgi:hypothetical protein